MINSIEINRFRGIEKLKLDDFDRINIITGKNNAGKSSILEAFFAFMDFTSPDMFNKINGFRGKNTIFYDTNIWEPLFLNMNTDDGYIIKIEKDGDNYELETIKDNTFVPGNVSTVPAAIVSQFRTAAKEKYSLKYKMIDSDKNYTSGHYLVANEGILLVPDREWTEENKVPYQHTQYINTQIARTESVTDKVSKLELGGQKRELIEILKIIDDEIEDLITLTSSGYAQLYVKKQGSVLPISYAGDGINKLLFIVLSIMCNSGAIILIDEIDAGFHYSMYEKLWKTISKTSKKYDCQIFATTHSYEAIVGAVDGMSDDKDDLAYYRIAKKNTNHTAYKYDYDELKAAVDANMEVR